MSQIVSSLIQVFLSLVNRHADQTLGVANAVTKAWSPAGFPPVNPINRVHWSAHLSWTTARYQVLLISAVWGWCFFSSKHQEDPKLCASKWIFLLSYPVHPQRRRWQSPGVSCNGSWRRLWNCSAVGGVGGRAPPSPRTLRAAAGRGPGPPPLPYHPSVPRCGRHRWLLEVWNQVRVSLWSYITNTFIQICIIFTHLSE